MLLRQTEIPDRVFVDHMAINGERMFTDPTYLHLAERAGKLASGAQRQRDHEVGLLPAAYFALRTSLDILTDERIETMPLEVAERTRVAALTSVAVTERAIRRGALIQYYNTNEHLAPLVSQSPKLRGVIEASGFAEIRYLCSLGKAAFEDAGLVIGGAMKYLQATNEAGIRVAERRGKWPVECIAGSLALQDISRVPNEHGNEMRKYMGMPYALARRFMKRPDGLLDFSAGARMRLESYHKARRGCPAHYISAPGSPYATMLQAMWAEMVDYSLPENATLREGEDIAALRDQLGKSGRPGGTRKRRR